MGRGFEFHRGHKNSLKQIYKMMATNINNIEELKALKKKVVELEAKMKEIKTNQSWDYENAHANDWREIKEMGEL